VSIFKQEGSRHYWYEFVYNGKRYRKSTKQGNARAAQDIENALKTELAKGNVGIVERPTIPTFAAFIPRFEDAISTQCKDKPRTIAFYKERVRRLEGFAPLANARLNEIDEQLIERLKFQRSRQISRLGRPLSIASINRELATLRRLLRLAHEWKVIDRVPRIRLFSGEVPREFVLSYEQEEHYLHMAPSPLKDVALLMLDTGMRPGEACALEWRHVRLDPAPGSRFGYVQVADGKSRNAKRNLSLTERVREMLGDRLEGAGKAEYVFPAESGEAWLVSSLDHQHTAFRELLGLPEAFVVHSLRHTMLTRLGESGADAFTIMRIAGHSSVTVSQRYVHPSPESLETAFARLDSLNRSKRQGTPVIPIASPVAKRAGGAK
jgi:integrase